MKKIKPILHVTCALASQIEIQEVAASLNKKFGDDYNIIVTDDCTGIKVYYSNFFVYCYGLIKSLKSNFIIRKKISI